MIIANIISERKCNCATLKEYSTFIASYNSFFLIYIHEFILFLGKLTDETNENTTKVSKLLIVW